MSDTWLQDLRFLIATDDQLQEDLDNICDILVDDAATCPEDASKSSKSALQGSKQPKDTAGKKIAEEKNCKQNTKRQRSYERQREEILCLRQQVEELTATLRGQKTDGVTILEMPLWERTAKQELAEKNKSMEENEYLREAVGQHATFIEQMQRVFRKKPRLTSHIDIHSEEWKYYKLAAQTSLREAAIHAIADRHQPLNLPANAAQSYTHVDPYTVYATYMQERNGQVWHSNMVRKYYVEPDREVIVSRNVYEDAALPQMTKETTEDRCMWLIVKPLADDPNRCRFTLLQYLVWPKEETALEADKIDDVLAKLTELCFQFRPASPGHIPLTTDIDLDALPFPTMAAFLERGIRFLDVLKAKLNDVVQHFNQQLVM
ncbi:hypothetical protein Ae201684P_021462 [Aphanomyces euteiches]|nr:hypothetical protein Ae201684P_021462 [Aphanomyces euteiches]